MRQDIEIHINTGDVTLVSSDSPNYGDFSWLSDVPDGELQERLYGEVTIKSTMTYKALLQQGIYVKIPYTPIAWSMKIRINLNGEYVTNFANKTEWFDVKVDLHNQGVVTSINASELMLVEDDYYYLAFAGAWNISHSVNNFAMSGYLQIYSALNKDFNIRQANIQNGNLLLKCAPTNNYRYPLTGVGMVRWVNGNMSSTDVAEAIQSEFSDDGVTINNAQYDEDTQKLVIDANYDNLD